jgi:hypothetical protein
VYAAVATPPPTGGADQSMFFALAAGAGPPRTEEGRRPITRTTQQAVAQWPNVHWRGVMRTQIQSSCRAGARSAGGAPACWQYISHGHFPPEDMSSYEVSKQVLPLEIDAGAPSIVAHVHVCAVLSKRDIEFSLQLREPSTVALLSGKHPYALKISFAEVGGADREYCARLQKRPKHVTRHQGEWAYGGVFAVEKPGYTEASIICSPCPQNVSPRRRRLKKPLFAIMTRARTARRDIATLASSMSTTSSTRCVRDRSGRNALRSLRSLPLTVVAFRHLRGLRCDHYVGAGNNQGAMCCAGST